MEEDVALIEITAEDDSLIQQSPSTDASASNCLFACSPLQILPSRPRTSHSSPNTVSLKNKGDVAKLTGSCAKGNGNKENINMLKSELPKLSVEPQQMKRRKKSSGYNLQKSLAWDKAFSTDEGFLNPVELSMLGGNKANSVNSYSTIDPFQRTPKKSSTQKGRRSSLTSGCPRPLDCSSLKRPANPSMIRSGLKESKLPKLPVSKTTAQSLDKFSSTYLPSASQTKHNQIGQDADTLKLASSQSSSKTTKIITSKNKFGTHSVSSSEKLAAPHPGRNKVQETSDERSISICDLQPRQPSLTDRVNPRLDASVAAPPPSGSRTTPAHKVIHKDEVRPEKVTIVATIPHAEVQSKRPSGLRMPSPSLSFFSQPKYSGPNSLSPRPTQPIYVPRSCDPNPQKLNSLNMQYDSRLLHASGKLLTKVANKFCSGIAEIPESSSVSMTAKLVDSTVLGKEEEVSFSSKCSEVINEHDAAERMTCYDRGFSERKSFGKVDQTSIQHEMDSPQKDNHQLVEDKSSDQLKKDEDNIIVDSLEYRSMTTSNLEAISVVSQKSCQVLDQDVLEFNEAVHCHHEESRSSSSTVPYETTFDLQLDGSVKYTQQDFLLTMNATDSNATHDGDQWKTERPETPSAFCGEDTDALMICPLNDGHLFLEDTSFEHLNYKLENFANGDLKVCISGDVLGSNAPVHTSAEQTYQDVSGSDHLRSKCSLDDDNNCSLLSETVVAEKCEGVHDLETRLGVASDLNQFDTLTENRGANPEDDAVVSKIIEHLQVDSSLSIAKETICVRSEDCLVGSQARKSISLQTSKDNELVEIFSMGEEEEFGTNGTEHLISPEKTETEAFSGGNYLEPENMKVDDRKVLGYQTQYFSEAPHIDVTDPGSAENHKSVLSSLRTVEVDEIEMNGVVNSLHKVSQLQPLNRNYCRLIDLATDRISSVASVDTNVESGQPQEVQNLNIAAEYICEENHDTYLNDCSLPSEGIGGEDKSPITAITGQERIDIIREQLPKDGSGVYVEKQIMYNESPGTIDIEPSIGPVSHSPDTLSKSDRMMHCLTLMDIETSLGRSAERGGKNSCLLNSHGQSFSDECVNLADEEQVDSIKSSPADIEPNIVQTSKSLVINYLHDQDNAKSATKDAKTTLSIKTPGDDGIVGNLSIKPPSNAVPFSEEWLAAMEAAGEEILTMKSGAVQNSPTYKTLPEPSPWSPVKRKQNQIGPYDCTKFINIPSQSD